jgi:hypothetical protein
MCEVMTTVTPRLRRAAWRRSRGWPGIQAVGGLVQEQHARLPSRACAKPRRWRMPLEYSRTGACRRARPTRRAGRAFGSGRP